MEKENDLIDTGETRNGNDFDFNELFNSYYSTLCLFSNKFLNDINLSRSVVQQVFVELWVKREKLSIKQSIKSYLFSSVRNASIDYLRKNKNRTDTLNLNDEKYQTPFRDLVEESELNEKINHAINDLPEKCREVFIACRFDGLKYAEIAEKLHLSVKTVEMQMGIAIKRLRTCLSEYQMVNLLVFIFSKK